MMRTEVTAVLGPTIGRATTYTAGRSETHGTGRLVLKAKLVGADGASLRVDLELLAAHHDPHDDDESLRGALQQLSERILAAIEGVELAD